MLFNSPEYIFAFLPFVAIVYFGLARLGYIEFAKVWVTGASVYFYASWNPDNLILLFLSMGFNFGIGRILSRDDQWRRRSILVFAICVNLAALAYYKYANFFVANVNAGFGTQWDIGEIILPLAISFYTFTQIAYLVDAWRGEAREYSFLHYCWFVCFFPHLIAGPIVHHSEMMPQFFDDKNAFFNIDNVSKGILIFCIGLFKKVVIADTFAIWANFGYGFDGTLTLPEAWVTSLCYTFQLYYDFSGYTDMAIGAALIFNIWLPINFNSPYKALSIQDFWRRWHMTLSRWLRDYLYIPLGGNRKGNYRTYFNLMATFVLGGLWHGAGWTFLIWGSLHGLALVAHRFWEKAGMKMPALLAWTMTFLFVNFTWVFFRAESVEQAMQIIRSMLGLNGVAVSAALLAILNNLPAINITLLTMQCVIIIVFALVAFLCKNSMEMTANKTRYNLKDSLTVSGSLLITVLLGIASTSSVFLYFNF